MAMGLPGIQEAMKNASTDCVYQKEKSTFPSRGDRARGPVMFTRTLDTPFCSGANSRRSVGSTEDIAGWLHDLGPWICGDVSLELEKDRRREQRMVWDAPIWRRRRLDRSRQTHVHRNVRETAERVGPPATHRLAGWAEVAKNRDT